MVTQSKIVGISEVLPQPEGAAFSIADRAGAPIATFSFASQAEATAARKFVEEAIALATSIRGYERSAPPAAETIPLDNLNASNDE